MYWVSTMWIVKARRAMYVGYVCGHAGVCWCVNECVRVCMRACVRECECVYVCECVCLYGYVCMCACCVCACVCVCLDARAHASGRAEKQTRQAGGEEASCGQPRAVKGKRRRGRAEVVFGFVEKRTQRPPPTPRSSENEVKWRLGQARARQ